MTLYKATSNLLFSGRPIYEVTKVLGHSASRFSSAPAPEAL